MSIRIFWILLATCSILSAQEPLRINDVPNGPSALVDLFIGGNDDFFLGEASSYLKRHPQSPFKEEIAWMQAHTLMRLGKSDPASSIFTDLTNSSKKEIRHRSLFDLANIFNMKKNSTMARSLLERIRLDPETTSIKEIASAQSLLLRFSLPSDSSLFRDIRAYAQQYPNSPALNELSYYAALSALQATNLTVAEEFSQNITGSKNDTIQRLLAEIALQRQNYAKAWELFLPLTQKENIFQDEALYKSGLIAKLNRDYLESRRFFATVVDYFPNSPYRDRARAEQALVNIILQNYDAALSYYRWESGFSGSRKAEALLKIAEIYFVKGDSRSMLRAARRVQKEFPYSAYANEALYWLGRMALNDKQFSQGIDLFNTYLIREPLSPKKNEIRIFLGQAYTGMGNIAEARQHYQAVVKDSPETEVAFNAMMGLGSSYSIENQPARALSFYDGVWQNAKAPPILKEQALYFAAASRYNLRQNKDSSAQFRRFLKDFPQSKLRQDASLALAKLSFKNENFEDVLLVDTSGIKDKEKLSELKELQAQSDFRLERYDTALTLFQEARGLTQNKSRRTSLLLSEAGALRNLNRRKDAVRLYEEYLKDVQASDSQNQIEEVLWNEITLTYIEAGETDKGIQNTEIFRQLFPKSIYLSELYFKLGDERFAQKKFKDAATLYKEAQITANKKDSSVEAALREGWSLDADKQFDKAELIFLSFLKDQSSHTATSAVLSKLIEYRDAQNDSAQANNFRNELIRRYPQSPDAEKARIILAGSISFDEADSTFITAAKQTRDKALKARILYRLALKYEAEGKIDRMFGILWEVRSLSDPIIGSEVILKMARATLNVGDPKGALNLFITVITDFSDDTAEALLGIVDSYIALEDIPNARRFTERLEEQFPKSPQTRRAREALRAALRRG
ncbi:MAG: tetratricopeptide repeat protein [Brevinema sp.]